MKHLILLLRINVTNATRWLSLWEHPWAGLAQPTMVLELTLGDGMGEIHSKAEIAMTEKPCKTSIACFVCKFTWKSLHSSNAQEWHCAGLDTLTSKCPPWVGRWHRCPSWRWWSGTCTRGKECSSSSRGLLMIEQIFERVLRETMSTNTEVQFKFQWTAGHTFRYLKVKKDTAHYLLPNQFVLYELRDCSFALLRKKPLLRRLYW